MSRSRDLDDFEYPPGVPWLNAVVSYGRGRKPDFDLETHYWFVDDLPADPSQRPGRPELAKLVKMAKRQQFGHCPVVQFASILDMGRSAAQSLNTLVQLARSRAAVSVRVPDDAGLWNPGTNLYLFDPGLFEGPVLWTYSFPRDYPDEWMVGESYPLDWVYLLDWQRRHDSTQRALRGLETAAEKGSRLGAPPKLTSEQLQEARQRLADGELMTQIARSFDVHATTLARSLERLGKKDA